MPVPKAWASPEAANSLLVEAAAEVARRRAILERGAFPEGFLLNDAGERVPYHEAQWRAWNSQARFVFVYAGTQGGKTAFGPSWLMREVQRQGGGDYLAATATYDLFKLKMLPALRRLFEYQTGLGRYWSGMKVIELCDPATLSFHAKTADDPMWGRIILRSAQAEGGLESSTAKAAWLDECGMDEFGIDSWDAVNRRLSIHEGRVLGTTTLYNRGWTKSEIYDRWRAGDKSIEVVQFPSYINPAFPKAEYDRMVERLPKWKVNMFYRGEFDVPEGLIYGPFESGTDVCDDFPVPEEWVRWGGIDFGGVHMAATCWAERPEDGHLFLIKEYMEGGRPIAEHALNLKLWGCRRWFGGAGSEDAWRREFAQHGMPIVEPKVSDVEVGIQAVYAVMVGKEMTVFRSCKRWLDEVGTYSRKVDASGQPTEVIQDKAAFHLLDTTRYLLSSLKRKKEPVKAVRLG